MLPSFRDLESVLCNASSEFRLAMEGKSLVRDIFAYDGRIESLLVV